MSDEKLAEKSVPDPCPACGAGPNGDGTFRLPKGWPFDPPCDECRRRGAEVVRTLGEGLARKLDEKFWKAFLGEASADEPTVLILPDGIDPDKARAVVRATDSPAPDAVVQEPTR